MLEDSNCRARPTYYFQWLNLLWWSLLSDFVTIEKTNLLESSPSLVGSLDLKTLRNTRQHRFGPVKAEESCTSPNVVSVA